MYSLSNSQPSIAAQYPKINSGDIDQRVRDEAVFLGRCVRPTCVSCGCLIIMR